MFERQAWSSSNKPSIWPLFAPMCGRATEYEPCPVWWQHLHLPCRSVCCDATFACRVGRLSPFVSECAIVRLNRLLCLHFFCQAYEALQRGVVTLAEVLDKTPPELAGGHAYMRAFQLLSADSLKTCTTSIIPEHQCVGSNNVAASVCRQSCACTRTHGDTGTVLPDRLMSF